MKTCERVQVELEALRSGELSPVEESQVRTHLQECAVCSEEAAAIREFGSRLGSELKAWVEAGTVPPYVSIQIEESIRSRRPWWNRWGLPAGAAAAAVLLLVATVNSRPEWAAQLASAPIVGGLLQTFVGNTLEEYEWGSKLPAEPVVPPALVVDINRQVTVEGVTLYVDRVEFDSDHTRVAYRLKGETFRLGGAHDLTVLQPSLEATTGSVPFRYATAQRKGDYYHFQASFGQTAPNQELTFRIDQLPKRAEGGPRWELGSNRLARPSTAFEATTVTLSAWSQVGERATVDVEWPVGQIVRFTDWQVRDASGKSYDVREVRTAVEGDRRIQTIVIDVPDNVALVLEAGAHDSAQPGPWSVTFTGR